MGIPISTRMGFHFLGLSIASSLELKGPWNQGPVAGWKMEMASRAEYGVRLGSAYLPRPFSSEDRDPADLETATQTMSGRLDQSPASLTLSLGWSGFGPFMRSVGPRPSPRSLCIGMYLEFV